MQTRKNHPLFQLSVVSLLVCLAALSVLFLAATPTRAASLYPTPTPTRAVTPTLTQAVTPTPTAAPGTSCKVTYVLLNSWPGGFQATINITNTGTTPMNGWILQFTFPNSQTLMNTFNAGFVQSGADVTLVNRTYNGLISPGSSLNAPLGLLATWNNIANNPPASFTLNGVLCSKG